MTIVVPHLILLIYDTLLMMLWSSTGNGNNHDAMVQSNIFICQWMGIISNIDSFHQIIIVSNQVNGMIDAQLSATTNVAAQLKGVGGLYKEVKHC